MTKYGPYLEAAAIETFFYGTERNRSENLSSYVAARAAGDGGAPWREAARSARRAYPLTKACWKQLHWRRTRRTQSHGYA